MTTKTTKITLVPSLDGYAIVPIKDWNEANSSSGEVEYQRQELERENAQLRELLTEMIVCGTCDDTGVVDSGGVLPWGESAMRECPECESRRANA